MLTKAITHSVIELAIEQWIHSLYFKPGLNWKCTTKETQILNNLKILQNLNIHPPSVVSKTIGHKIQTLNYFKSFVGSMFRSSSREFSNFFKIKESVENVYFYQGSGEDEFNFDTLELMEEFLNNDYDYHHLSRSLSRSMSENESADESCTNERHSQAVPNPGPQQQAEVLKEWKSGPGKDDTHYSISTSRRADAVRIAKRFVNYSFDVTKQAFAKNEGFVMVMRFRSPPVTDFSPLEQYSKVNAHQSEPKTAHSEHGEEMRLQFPVRRFLACVEVTRNEVKFMGYNVKEDVISKLFETLVEEITFHEIRETLIVGLSSQKAMEAAITTDTSEFEASLCERYEQTQIENHKKLNEKEIGLKLTWDYRFGDKDPNRLKAKEDQTTITDQVFELIRKSSNCAVVPECRISITERNKTKKLMDAVISTIRTTYRKMKAENLEVRYLNEPTFLNGTWFGQLLKGEDVSKSSQGSQSIADGSQLATKEQNRNSLFLAVPKKSLDEGSERSVSHKSRKKRVLSSMNSPMPLSNYHSARLKKKEWTIDIPMPPAYIDDLPSPTEIDDARPLKKTRTETSFSNASIRSSYEELEAIEGKGLLGDHLSLEAYVDRAVANLGFLQKNFAMHVFDLKVRQMFTLNEDLRMDHFLSIKHQRTFSSPSRAQDRERVPPVLLRRRDNC